MSIADVRRALAVKVEAAIPDLSHCAAYPGGVIEAGSAAVVPADEAATPTRLCVLEWTLELWIVMPATDLPTTSETLDGWVEQLHAALVADPTLNGTASTAPMIATVDRPIVATTGGGGEALWCRITFVPIEPQGA